MTSSVTLHHTVSQTPPAVAAYREALASTAQRLTLNMANWKAAEWNDVIALVTQEVLHDAFQSRDTIVDLFQPHLGVRIESRGEKSLARVIQKITEQPANPERHNFFKVVSDFFAVRVSCEVSQISDLVARIQAIAFANDGLVYIRGSSPQQPFGSSVSTNGKKADIVQYVYTLLKGGHVTEWQVGHPFPAETFRRDSALRANKKDCGEVDLWTNDFYNTVKKYLLAHANSEQPAVTKAAILNQAMDLHNGTIPDALNAILLALPENG